MKIDEAALRAAGIGVAAIFTPRHTDLTEEVIYRGEDIRGAAIVGAIRLYPDAPGDPVANFTVGAVTFDGTDSHFTIGLTELAKEAMPASGTPGANAEFYYDVAVTRGGGTRQIEFGGLFTLVSGAVQ